MNKLNKLSTGAGVFVIAMVVTTASAFATTPTPSSEANSLFDSNWSQVTDLIKGMAPKIILAGLTLLAIRKVVSSISRARAPRF
jgi:hypothetical protein